MLDECIDHMLKCSSMLHDFAPTAKDDFLSWLCAF
jgi:hypothetical protein